jgi:hypothetical protein
MVTLQHIFSVLEDKHIDVPVVVQQDLTIPITKGRGKAPMSIMPLSTPLFYGGPQTIPLLTEIGAQWLAYVSINYGVVQLQVPYSKWDVLCGDIVTISHHLVLDGAGLRGVVDRHGVVIERRVNLDPARPRRIDLTIMLTPKNACGYAPAGFITAAEDLGSNAWVLTFDPTHVLNQAMSADGSGEVYRHFGVNDYIQLQQFDSYTSTDLAGIVTAGDYDAGTLTVQFDGAGYPGYDSEGPFFVLEFALDDGSHDPSANQKKFAIVANNDGRLGDGTFGRRLQ